MKSGEEQYEQWLQEMRLASPVLREPEKMVELIFEGIENTSRRKKKISKLINWSLSVAASLLFTLFVYETYVYPITFDRDQAGIALQSTNFLLEPKEPEETIVWTPEMGVIEKSQRLSAVWKERREEESRKKIFIYKFSQITHTNLIK